jgi:hypothetical protein
MELWRLKNTDTRIVFPICDADGDPTSHADDNTPDSEWLSWNTSDHGGAAPSFADCTHEYVEIAGGFYYLDVSAAEINADFTIIQMKTALAGCKTQAILIRTYINSNEDLHAHIASIEADTNELQAEFVDTGRLDTIIDGIETHVHAIDGKTTNLPASPAAVGSAMTLADDAITSAKFDETSAFPLKATDSSTTILARAGNKMDIVDAPTSTGVLVIADAFLTRAFGSVTYTETTRCVLTALQKLRNKVANTAGTQTVYKENDSTVSWTSTLTADANAEPIVSIDPDS